MFLSRSLLNSTLLTVILTLLLTMSALAQTGGSYAIPWLTITNGGGSSTDGHYTLIDTIGHPNALGFASTDNQRYAITDSFWVGKSSRVFLPIVTK